MAALPESYVSSICEVKTPDNELVATGSIKAITEEYIEIRNKAIAKAQIGYGARVKVNVFNHKEGFRVMEGTVYLATSQFLRLIDTVALTNEERRQYFRVDTQIHASIQRAKVTPMRVDVNVRDLSLGGAQITSDVELAIGEQLFLCMKLGKLNCMLRSTVRRQLSNDEDGKMRFGLEFTGISDVQSSALSAFVMQIQREQISKHRKRYD